MIKPILFNTDMVLSTLDRRKTATRRIVKKPYFVQDNGFKPLAVRTAPKGSQLYREIGRMPYPDNLYRIGNLLYVRETWSEIKNPDGSHKKYVYKASDTYPFEEKGYIVKFRWHPSIHMPKDAARIWLNVTDVRVERLQNMTLDDFLKEGITVRPEVFNDPESAYLQARRMFI